MCIRNRWRNRVQTLWTSWSSVKCLLSIVQLFCSDTHSEATPCLVLTEGCRSVKSDIINLLNTTLLFHYNTELSLCNLHNIEIYIGCPFADRECSNRLSSHRSLTSEWVAHILTNAKFNSLEDTLLSHNEIVGTIAIDSGIFVCKVSIVEISNQSNYIASHIVIKCIFAIFVFARVWLNWRIVCNCILWEDRLVVFNDQSFTLCGECYVHPICTYIIMINDISVLNIYQAINLSLIKQCTATWIVELVVSYSYRCYSRSVDHFILLQNLFYQFFSMTLG